MSGAGVGILVYLIRVNGNPGGRFRCAIAQLCGTVYRSIHAAAGIWHEKNRGRQ